MHSVVTNRASRSDGELRAQGDTYVGLSPKFVGCCWSDPRVACATLSPVPFTYFAHQVPVLPLKIKAPDRWDGLALVVGSILPDLWYVSSGWLYGPAGIPLWVNGHNVATILQNCVVPGTVLTILLRRWTVPVVPAMLPKGGFLRLRDYRLLALSRHRWWVTAYSVAVGALTHIVLDGFTHNDGWAVEAIPALREPILTIGDRSVRIYKALQYGGHVFGSIAGAYLLLWISRRKLQWVWHGYAGRRPPDPVVRPPGRAVVWAVLSTGAFLALAYGAKRLADGDGGVPAFMGFSCVALLTLLAAGVAGRRYVGALPAAVDPVVE